MRELLTNDRSSENIKADYGGGFLESGVNTYKWDK